MVNAVHTAMNKREYMNYGVTECPYFLTSELHTDELTASGRSCFKPGRRVTGIHSVGGWVGCNSGVGTLEKGKIRKGFPYGTQTFLLFFT